MEYVKKNKNLIIGILVFILFFVINIITNSIIKILIMLGLDIKHLPLIAKQIILILQAMVFPIILFFIYFKTFKKDIKKFKGNARFYVETAVTAYTIGIICMVLSNLFLQSFLKLPLAQNEQEIRKMLVNMPLYIFISSALFGPFEEEMVFRKALRDVFKNKKLYIIMSGLIFGALHVVTLFSNPLELLYIIPYGALGTAFAYMYVKTDNIFVPILVHTIHNVLLISIQLLVV